MSGVREFFERAKFRLSYWNVARRSSIILSAGMPRSGSTWLFNAARLLLQQNGDLGSGWIGDWARLPRRPSMLLKVHDHDPFLARHARVILYSYRDIRDALASSKRKFQTEPTLELARHWLASDQQWRARAAFTLRYESMIADPVQAVAELAQALRLPHVNPELIQRQLMEVDYQPLRATGPAEYDGETLLHPGHISDGRHGTWNQWLSPMLTRQLEVECGEWLTNNDYPVGSLSALERDRMAPIAM